MLSRHYNVLLCGLLALVCASCANRGIGPQGGPRDTIPPRVVREQPQNGTLNYTGRKVDIWFNEYLQLNNVADNVLISPPQQRQPEVKAVGKHLMVHFADSLLDSTTYVIDFGEAVCDYNEKIPLRGYTFAFSTGDVIDSLTLSGRVLNAEDLNPVSGVLAGIHADLSDSALATLPFTRITRTDSAGLFTLRNIRPDTYRLYALHDVSRDYVYQPGEALAVFDTLLTPPDSLLHTLFFYTEDKQRHYLQRTLREERHRVKLIFAAPQDSMPVVTLPDGEALPPSVLVQASIRRDTISYWLTDSALIAADTLTWLASYLRSDSLYRLEPHTDTLFAVYREPRLSDKAREARAEKEAKRQLDIKSNASAKFQVYDTLRLRFDMPLASLRDTAFRLLEKRDTSFVPIPLRLQMADSARMACYVLFDSKPDGRYELRIDSAACRDIYGHTHGAQKFTLRIRPLSDYTTLTILLRQYDPKAVLQLLNDKDKVVRTLPAQPEGTQFRHLEPGTYYLRLFIDLNGDGRWTTGDLQLKRQPEPVYYFHKKMGLRANWDFEEEFDHLAAPVGSKPKELRKPFNPAKKK